MIDICKQDLLEPKLLWKIQDGPWRLSHCACRMAPVAWLLSLLSLCLSLSLSFCFSRSLSHSFPLFFSDMHAREGRDMHVGSWGYACGGVVDMHVGRRGRCSQGMGYMHVRGSGTCMRRGGGNGEYACSAFFCVLEPTCHTNNT